MTQEAVFPSDANFTNGGNPLLFTPTSPRTVRIVSTIIDDDYALEDVESYFVTFINPQPRPSDNRYISIGPPTNIRIVSDDGKCMYYWVCVC